MPFTFEISENQEFVLVRHYGHVAPAEFEEVVLRTEQEIAEPATCRILIDVTDVDSYPSRADYVVWIHERPRPLPAVHKVAIVTSAEYQDTIEFLALAAQNRGNNVYPFLSESEAMSWLFGRADGAP